MEKVSVTNKGIKFVSAFPNTDASRKVKEHQAVDKAQVLVVFE